MSDQITYDDKADLIVDTTIDDIFKVSASDMNEIKNVVNGNAEEVGDITSLTTPDKTSVVNAVNELNAPEKWVSVGATAPTDGRRVWFEKGKNLFNKNAQLYKSNCYIDGSGQEGSNTEWSIFRTNLEPNTTYTLTNSGASSIPGYVLYNSSGERVGGSNYSNRSHITFTTTSDTSYMLESVVANTLSDRYDLDIFQIEQGSTATSYEAYINPSINVDNSTLIGQDNLVSVGVNQPSDGKRIWFEYSRNILPENLYMATRTLNGITYTNNGDGTISFSGTATANTSIQIIPDSQMSFKAGQPYYLYSSVPYNSTTFNLSIALTENGATRDLLANGTYTPTYNSTQARLSLYIPSGTTINATNVKLMLIEGNTAPSEYEPYVEEGIYIDGKKWYDKLLAIKTKVYPSITTSSAGYYNLNLKCNKVAIIGFTHDPIASATILQLYSNEQGWWFIRCSVNNGAYGERTITNLKIYYI